MRPPLEYGDNFPVPTGSWDPTVPWRFPRHEIRLRPPSLWGQVLPWVMLGLGITLGVLWMGWRLEMPLRGMGEPRSGSVSQERIGEIPQIPSRDPAEAVPRIFPTKTKSRVA